MTTNDLYGFSQAAFNGVGYVARRSKNVPWDTKDCSQIKIQAPVNGQHAVLVSQFDIVKSQISSTSGFLTFSSPTSSHGKLTGTAWIPSGDFRVFRTSTSPRAAAIYSCVPFLGIFKKEYLWIWVDNKSDVSNAEYVLVNSLTEINTFTRADMITPNQGDNCRYMSADP